MTENQNTGVTTSEQNKQALAPWKSAVSTGMTKFAMIDSKRAKIEAGFASQIIEGSPALQRIALTQPGFNSIVNAVLNVARMGITLNPSMKLAYLIPRKGLCVLDPSYMGLVKILTDGKDVKYVSAALVYEDEEFEFVDAYTVKHVRKDAKTEAEQNTRVLRGALSCAMLADGQKVYEFMPAWELEKVERMSAAAGSGSSPYSNWRSEMQKKAAIRRHYKNLPKGTNAEAVQAVIESEEAIFKQAADKGKAVDVFGETDPATEEATYEEVDSTAGEVEKLKLDAPADTVKEGDDDPGKLSAQKVIDAKDALDKMDETKKVTPSLKDVGKKKANPDDDKLFS